MTISEMFDGFIDNFAIENGDTISLRYGELTAALNKRFRNTESKTANSLQVGSLGRSTHPNHRLRGETKRIPPALPE
jgi:hypothetical protein